jgi:hypothetical protein
MVENRNKKFQLLWSPHPKNEDRIKSPYDNDQTYQLEKRREELWIRR